MVIITKLSAQQRPGRYNLFLDNHYAFSVSERTVAEFVLLKGKELTDEEINKIQEFDTNAKASDLAAKYLSYEMRTVYEVLQYLKKKGISLEAAQNAVDELVSLGYLNDEQYAQLFIKQNLNIGNEGPRSIQNKLAKKGIGNDIIENELEKIDEDSWIDPGVKAVKSLTNKVGSVSKTELEQKIRTKLMTRGFNSDMISSVISALDLNSSSEDELEALKKQGIKAYKRFRRFDERERKFKIKRYLYTHGFSSGEIEAFLNGEVIPLDELEDY